MIARSSPHLLTLFLISFPQTLCDAHEKGWTRILKYQTTREMIENHYTELRRTSQGASGGGAGRGVDMESLGMDEVLMSGVLEKKAGKGRHWQGRGVTLKPKYLYYFETHNLKGEMLIV